MSNHQGLPTRKNNRLKGFDYSTPGAYFITICTQDKACLLGRIVGGGAFDAPQIHLTQAGKVVEKYILSGNAVAGVTVDKFIVMPNHIHMLLLVDRENNGGTSRAPSPTNAVIPHFVSTLKRFCYQALGKKVFQRSYHDHVIRGEEDYLRIWQYIDTNTVKWKEDCFYVEEK